MGIFITKSLLHIEKNSTFGKIKNRNKNESNKRQANTNGYLHQK